MLVSRAEVTALIYLSPLAISIWKQWNPFIASLLLYPAMMVTDTVFDITRVGSYWRTKLSTLVPKVGVGVANMMIARAISK